MRKLQRGVEPLWPVWKTGASTARPLKQSSPPESRTPLSGLRAQCITHQCLRGMSPPGRNRTSVTPRIRRVLVPGLSYGREIRWGGLEPPPRGPQPRALPGELRTWGLPVGFEPTRSRLRGGCSATSELQELALQGRDSNPCRAAYEAAARPLSYPATTHTAGGSRTLTGTWPTTF